MYPKNAASPEPIAIGPVIQISDGAVQTSGCTVRIKPIGVAEGDGGGTTAYSTDGIVLYTPTQAETNYTSFVLIAKKTGCIPASVTVITTSSATSGTVLLAPVTHTSATIPTVTTTTTATTVGSVTGNVGGNVTGSVGSVVGAVGSVTGAVGSVTGLTPATVHSDLDDIQSRLPAALVSGRMDSYTGAMATNVITADAAAADFIGASEIAASASQEIADLIAADWVAGDASPLAIAAAVRTNLATELARMDVDMSSRMATYTQPTGFLAATFPGTVASPTNITAGTITTVTTLTNLPAITANWLTAAGLAADAVTEIQVGLALEATSQLIKTQATIAAQKPEVI